MYVVRPPSFFIRKGYNFCIVGLCSVLDNQEQGDIRGEAAQNLEEGTSTCCGILQAALESFLGQAFNQEV